MTSRIFFAFCMALVWVVPFSAQAVMLYMDPGSFELMRGDTRAISVRMNTDAEHCVNVVDATIHYSENIEPVDTSRGSSILSIWLEPPTINKEKRTITFAGGIPNGYCGRIDGDPRLTNNIIDILFMSPGMQVGSTESGNIAKISFGDETRVLLNDGFGTEAEPSMYGTEIFLSRDAGSRVENPWLDAINNDKIPPEEFTISLEREPSAFSGRYFIVFNTTDKQSGIAYYEIMEEPLEFRNMFMWGGVDAPWKRVESPYVLEDQSLNSTIRVRAVDKAGNEYVATLVPAQDARTIPRELFVVALVGFIVLVSVIASVVVIYVVIRNRRSHKNTEQTDDGYVENNDDE